MISFGTSGNKQIRYPSTLVQNQTKWSFSCWVNILANSTLDVYQTIFLAGSFWNFYYRRDTGRIYFYVPWTTGDGFWYITAPSLNTLNHFVVTYDGTSNSNTPIIYMNGASQSVTRELQPTGSLPTGSSNFYIGDEVYEPCFKIQDVKVYNRVLSAIEALELYSSKSLINNFSGIIFQDKLISAKDCASFDGTTLAASNTFLDEVSNAVGVPTNNLVIGYADTFQIYK